MPHSDNDLAFPDRKISETFLHFAEPLLRGLGPDATDDQLIFRKHNLFGNDHRLVGEFKLTRKNGELNLRAEARDPRRQK